MTAGRLATATVVGFFLLVASKVLERSGAVSIWPPLIEVANVVVAFCLVLAVSVVLKPRIALFGQVFDDLEVLRSLLVRLFKWVSSSKPRVRTTPRPSISGWLVSAAVQRLPATMGEQEKGRWEEEMRADVASVPRRRRLVVAFMIWRKGAPAMPTGSELAPRLLD